MKYNVQMPSLGADMDQGKLMKWLIKPGDDVKSGQTIAVVETTKSTVEIESFRDGKVIELLGKEGQVINVGKTIAYFDIVSEPGMKRGIPSRIKITPAAKRLASENKLDIAHIIGSGTEGQIELKDIQKILNFSKETSSTQSTLTNLRQAIAKAMSRSKKEIPHYYLKKRISLDLFMNWMDEQNFNRGSKDRLLVPAVLMRAIIYALKEYPEMNGYYENDQFKNIESINLGVAVSLKESGVIVPSLLDAQKLSLSELNIKFQDLLVRARNGELKNRELTEGTITVTNLGDLGSDEVYGIIFPPQVCLVGLGRIRKEAIIENETVKPGFVIDLTLSADHRVSDGLKGARFLECISKYLTEPSMLEDKNERFSNKIEIERNLSGTMS